VHEPRHVAHDGLGRQACDQGVHVGAEPCDLVAADVVGSHCDGDDIGGEPSQLRKLVGDDIVDSSARDAQVDDQHGTTGRGAQPLGDQADVAPLRTTGPDPLDGGVTKGDIHDPARLASGRRPVLAVSVHICAELPEPKPPPNRDGEGQGQEG